MKVINKFLCVNLSNPILFYPYTRFKLINKLRPKSSCRPSSPRRLDLNAIQKATTPSRVLVVILTRELLNQHVIASKLDFEFIVEAKHQ